MSSLKKIENGGVTEVGLVIPDNITPEQHHQLGVSLVETKERFDKGYQWAMGDWYNTIPHGDKQKEVESLGLNYKVVKNWGAVASYFAMSLRSDNLSFTHHLLLAHDGRINKTQAKSLLNQAEQNKWSKRDLQVEVDKLLGVYEEPVEVDSGDAIERFVTDSLPNIPTKYKKQVERVVKSAAVKLANDFENQVKKQVEVKVKEQRKQLEDLKQKAQTEFDNAVKLKSGVKAYMTDKEFKLIRSLLHPDKHDGDTRYKKAFDIFNRLAETTADLRIVS